MHIGDPYDLKNQGGLGQSPFSQYPNPLTTSTVYPPAQKTGKIRYNPGYPNGENTFTMNMIKDIIVNGITNVDEKSLMISTEVTIDIPHVPRAVKIVVSGTRDLKVEDLRDVQVNTVSQYAGIGVDLNLREFYHTSNSVDKVPLVEGGIKVNFELVLSRDSINNLYSTLVGNKFDQAIEEKLSDL